MDRGAISCRIRLRNYLQTHGVGEASSLPIRKNAQDFCFANTTCSQHPLLVFFGCSGPPISKIAYGKCRTWSIPIPVFPVDCESFDSMHQSIPEDRVERAVFKWKLFEFMQMSLPAFFPFARYYVYARSAGRDALSRQSADMCVLESEVPELLRFAESCNPKSIWEGLVNNGWSSGDRESGDSINQPPQCSPAPPAASAVCAAAVPRLRFAPSASRPAPRPRP